MYCQYASSETHGQLVGRGRVEKGEKKIGGRKGKEDRKKEPLGTKPYRTSSKRPRQCWLLIGHKNTKEEGSWFLARQHELAQVH